MSGYTVHPAAAAFPVIEGEELQKLVDDIKANGLRHPVVFNHDGSVLIDGRNRLRACEIAGVNIATENLPEDYTDEQIISFIVSANVLRRHLTQSQKAAVATALEPMYAEAAKERMLTGKKDPEENLPQGSGRAPQSRDQAAKDVGVSGRAVSQAKALKRDAPDLFDKVAAGTITLNAADRELKQRNAKPTPTRPTPAEPTPSTGAKENPNPVPPTATAAPVDGDTLDAEIAALQETIRVRLWSVAAFKWWNQYGGGEPYSSPFEESDRINPAMIVVWQNAIDRGIAKPVTKEPNFSSFTVPDAPWPGLGLSERDHDDDDWQAWDEAWLWCDIGPDTMMSGQARQLAQLWVYRETARLLGVDFFCDGWFVYSSDRTVTIDTTIEVPTPGHLFDEVIFKVDLSAQGAVDCFGEDDDQKLR